MRTSALLLVVAAGCGSAPNEPVPAPSQPTPAPEPVPEPESDPEPRPRRAYPSELVEGEPMYEVLPPDAIPSIDAPVFVSAADADAFLLPEETVLGVVGRDGTAKAYSAWYLDHHEIVNDELDGEPIAATW